MHKKLIKDCMNIIDLVDSFMAAAEPIANAGRDAEDIWDASFNRDAHVHLTLSIAELRALDALVQLVKRNKPPVTLKLAATYLNDEIVQGGRPPWYVTIGVTNDGLIVYSKSKDVLQKVKMPPLYLGWPLEMKYAPNVKPCLSKNFKPEKVK